jgi:hypothetical protein
MSGQRTCYLHGGKTPGSLAKAAERRAEAATRLTLYRDGITPVTNVLEAFQQVVSETVAFKDVLERRVGELAAGEWRFTDEKGGEQLRSEISLYERAMDRAGKFLEAWAKLGLEERMVKLEESKVAIVVAAFLASLEESGASGEVAEKMREVFARRLSLGS